MKNGYYAVVLTTWKEGCRSQALHRHLALFGFGSKSFGLKYCLKRLFYKNSFDFKLLSNLVRARATPAVSQNQEQKPFLDAKGEKRYSNSGTIRPSPAVSQKHQHPKPNFGSQK